MASLAHTESTAIAQRSGWFDGLTGLAAAGEFGGSVIAFGTLLLFDNWLWPDRGEDISLESLEISVKRYRSRLLEAADYYHDRANAPRPPLPPPTSDLPEHMNFHSRAVADGVSTHRHAILAAVITRVLEVDRLTIETLKGVPHDIRKMAQPELRATVDASAVVLDELAHEFRTYIPAGGDNPPPPSQLRAQLAMLALRERLGQVRPVYIRTVSSAEIEDFAAWTDSLATLTSYIERPLFFRRSRRFVRKNQGTESGHRRGQAYRARYRGTVECHSIPPKCPR